MFDSRVVSNKIGKFSWVYSDVLSHYLGGSGIIGYGIFDFNFINTTAFFGLWNKICCIVFTRGDCDCGNKLDFRDHNRIFHLGVSHIEGSVNKYGNTKERRVFLLGDKYG
jgi:hypothetical protein